MSKINRKGNIRRKITVTMVTVVLLSLAIMGATAAISFTQMRGETVRINGDMADQAAEDSRIILENEAMDKLAALAFATADTVSARIQSIMSQVDILAFSAEALYADPNSFGRVQVLPPDAANQGIFVSQIVYAERTEPESVTDEVGLIGNLGNQMNGVSEFLSGAGTTQIGTESGFIIMCDENSGLKTSMGYLDPVERGWYRMAADSGQLAWSEVFEDTYGRGLAVTCGKPVYDPGGDLRAVISIGSTLDNIGASVTQLEVGETGYAFVVDRSGQVIMSRDLTVDSEGHVVGISNLQSDGDLPQAVVADIMAGHEGVAQVEYDGVPVYMAYVPMESMPWTVITVMSVEEVLAPSQRGAANIAALASDAETRIDGIMVMEAVIFLAALAAAVFITVIVSVFMARRITGPLMHLTDQVGQISGGDLDNHIQIHTNDEIEALADAFNSMTANLKQYIRDLTSITAEKERIGAELDIATHIQSSMLPCIFPAFPERDEFDIYATMNPAKEVGGDFYDFFMVDDTHLAVVMADVSGKGVPAALFMVIGKTLIKDHTTPGCDLGQVFGEVNELLCESNSEGLFITAFEGVLDLETGELNFVNAGHEMPFIRRANGAFEPYKISPGFVLAGMEGMRYKTGSMMLQPGDKLFQYTDGVTEATNGQNELYGMDRLEAVLNRFGGDVPDVILPSVKADIDTFVGDAPQFDDITMLCLEFKKKVDR